MGRLSGLTDAVNSLLAEFGVELAPWMAPVFGLLLGALLLPMILRNDRTGRARKLIPRLVETSAAERDAARARILALVADNPVGLVVVAEESLRRGQVPLARMAVAALVRSGKRPADARRLLLELEGPPPTMPTEAALVVERLLSAGLLDEAERRLASAVARWPDDPELAAVEEHLDAARQSQAPGSASSVP